jgi:hypothetical protein
MRINAVLMLLCGLTLSVFASERRIEASVLGAEVVECRLSPSGGYSAVLEVNVAFTNRSRKSVLFYRETSISGEKMATTKDQLKAKTALQADMIGYTDKMKIKEPILEQFIALKSGDTYHSSMRHELLESRHANVGDYWVQVNISTQPDAFYFLPKSREHFQRQWKSVGVLADDDVWTKPFSVKLRHDTTALCPSSQTSQLDVHPKTP